jgi:hypothetical protein
MQTKLKIWRGAGNWQRAAAGHYFLVVTVYHKLLKNACMGAVFKVQKI